MRLFATIAVVLSAQPARAEDPAITVRARLEPGELAVGEKAKLAVDVTIPRGFHLWSMDPGPGPLALTLALPANAPLSLEGSWYGSEPVKHMDRGFQRELTLYEGSAHFEHLVKLTRAPARGEDVSLVVRGQICTEEVCVGQKVDVKLALAVSASPVDRAELVLAGAPLAMRAGGAAPAEVAPPVVASGANAPREGVRNDGDDVAKAKEKGVLAFLLLAFSCGLLALATPCVFPAIPLTISFFSKYSEESFARGARLAAVYALTMVATFTFAGVVISVVFGAAGVQSFASHPLFQLTLAAALIFFALNLLGWFEIGVPAFVLTFVNRLETRYGQGSLVGTERKSGARDYLVVSIAAVTATTVFFTCTVGFVGGMLAAAASGEWFWPTIGMAAFGCAFAFPFFLLAMFPQGARRLRGKSGNWLTATRVTLGFLELAAAAMYIANADRVWLKALTREMVLAFWVPLFTVAGLYLLGKIRLGHEPPPAEGEGHISVPRMLVSTGMFGLAIYLASGLFSGRPFGGWIDGFLPTTTTSVVAGSAQAQLAWRHDLDEGRRVARERGGLVFVNYTGYTCTNCRYMESGVFPQPAVASLLEKMTLVELYTDGANAETDRNREDQVKRFGTAALPFYSVERADGTIIETFASSTNDAAEFQRFLERAFEKAKAPAPAPTPAAEPVIAGLVLKTSRLTDGKAEAAIVPGRWTLINFWASWCPACIEELREFLIASGRDLEAKGGRFAAIAVEYDDAGIAKAREIMDGMKLPAGSAFMLPTSFGETEVDAKLEFDGSVLPFTVLIAPTGEIVWKTKSKLSEPELKAKLACYVGDAPSDVSSKGWLARKCSGSAR